MQTWTITSLIQLKAKQIGCKFTGNKMLNRTIHLEITGDSKTISVKVGILSTAGENHGYS